MWVEFRDRMDGPLRRVLVADDNRDSAESLQMLLSILGHEVAVAYDGPSALKAAAAYAPDVMLLDIGLPQLDGYEVAKRIRERGIDALLVAVTGWVHEEDKRRALEAGFDAHLTKPIDVGELEKLLE